MWPLYGTEQHGFITAATPGTLFLCFPIYFLTSTVNILRLLVFLIFGGHLIDSLLVDKLFSIRAVFFFSSIVFFIVSSLANIDEFKCPYFAFWPLCVLLKHAFAIRSTFINF